jgi:3-methylfumaryl-CoA hydratase
MNYPELWSIKMPLTLDPAKLKQWIGRSETALDTIDACPASLMNTILPSDREFTLGTKLPPLWNWLYFPVQTPLEELAADGHPALGGFLPPVDLPRRMWAGGRFEFSRDLTISSQVQRTSKIINVALKSGRTGRLCFVTVRHEYLSDGNICLSEEHDIVYRDHPNPPGARTSPTKTSPNS